jgi:DNA polymerase-1
MNLAYRCFHGMPDLKRTDGFPTGAIHGWLSALGRLQSAYQPKRIVVFFDKGMCRRRIELLPDYKAQRPTMPEDLQLQLPVLKDFTVALGHPLIEEEAVEADDLIAAFAVKESLSKGHVGIVSSDKDFAQILDREWILQVLPPPSANPKLGWRLLDRAGVYEKWGIGPHQMVDYLSLIGDVSDNILGIPGVGPKTAVKWLEAHENLEGILASIPQIHPARFQPILQAAQELLWRNRQLIQLNTALDLPHLPEPSGLHRLQVLQLCQTMELHQWHQKFQGELF